MSRKIQPPAPSAGEGAGEEVEEPERFEGDVYTIARDTIKQVLEKFDMSLRMKETEKLVEQFAIEAVISASHCSVPHLLPSPDDKPAQAGEDLEPLKVRIDAWAGGSQIGFDKRVPSHISGAGASVPTKRTKSIVSGGSVLDRKRAPSMISSTTGAFTMLKKKDDGEPSKLRVIELQVETVEIDDEVTEAELDRMRFRVKRKKQEEEERKAEMEKEKKISDKQKQKEKEQVHTYDHKGNILVVKAAPAGKGVGFRQAGYDVSSPILEQPSISESKTSNTSKKRKKSFLQDTKGSIEQQLPQQDSKQEGEKGRRGAGKGQEKPGLTNPLLPPPPLISEENAFMRTIKDHIRPIMGVAYKEREFSIGGQTYKEDPQRTMMTKDEYMLTVNNVTSDNFPGKKPRRQTQAKGLNQTLPDMNSPQSDRRGTIDVARIQNQSLDMMMMTNMSEQSSAHDGNTPLLPDIPGHLKPNQLPPTIMGKRGVKRFSVIPGLGNPQKKASAKVPQHVVSHHPLLSPRAETDGVGISHVINYRSSKTPVSQSVENPPSLHDKFNQQILFSNDWGSPSMGDGLSPKSAVVKRIDNKGNYQSHPLSVRAKDVKQLIKGLQPGRLNKLPPPPLGKSFGHGVIGDTGNRLLGRNLMEDLEISGNSKRGGELSDLTSPQM